MSLRNSFYVTIFVYLLTIFMILQKESFQTSEKIEIDRGSSKVFSLNFSQAEKGVGSVEEIKNNSTSEGSIAEEINQIRNKIVYPPQALEDGLESECEWSVTIDVNQSATNIKTIHPCKYRIFEEEFYRVIHNWKFHLPPETILFIPVSFKIK